MSKPWRHPLPALIRQFFTPIIGLVSGTIFTLTLFIAVWCATGWTSQQMFDASHPLEFAIAAVCVGCGILATLGVAYAFNRLFRSLWPEHPDDDHE